MLQIEGSTWLKYADIQDLNDRRMLMSTDVMETLQSVNGPVGSAPVLAVELSYMESFFGLESKKGKTTALEMLIQAAKLGRNGNSMSRISILSITHWFSIQWKGF